MHTYRRARALQGVAASQGAAGQISAHERHDAFEQPRVPVGWHLQQPETAEAHEGQEQRLVLCLYVYMYVYVCMHEYV
jgi:hypothetical protein